MPPIIWNSRADACLPLDKPPSRSLTSCQHWQQGLREDRMTRGLLQRRCLRVRWPRGTWTSCPFVTFYWLIEIFVEPGCLCGRRMLSTAQCSAHQALYSHLCTFWTYWKTDKWIGEHIHVCTRPKHSNSDASWLFVGDCYLGAETVLQPITLCAQQSRFPRSRFTSFSIMDEERKNKTAWIQTIWKPLLFSDWMPWQGIIV